MLWTQELVGALNFRHLDFGIISLAEWEFNLEEVLAGGLH